MLLCACAQHSTRPMELPDVAEHLLIRAALVCLHKPERIMSQRIGGETHMSRNMYSLVAALALACASVTSHAQSALTSRYSLTLLQPPGEQQPGLVNIADINNSNEIVGSHAAPNHSGARSFIWRNGIFRELTPLLGERNASPRSINEKSAILGTIDFVHAFVIQRGRVTEIAPPAGESFFDVRNLNNRGQALFRTHIDPFGFNNYVWQDGQFIRLEPLPDSSLTQAARINDRGTVVGTAFLPEFGTSVAVLWQNGTIMPLASPEGARDVNGIDVNNRGVVLLDALFLSAPSHRSAFLWREGELTELPALPGTNDVQLFDLSNRGQVVGLTPTDFGADSVATLWEHGRVFDLNTRIASDDPLQPFVHLTSAEMINDNGWIVGGGIDSRDPNGRLSFYLLTPR